MENVQQQIVPHLWFDKEAKEAAEFYVSIFPDSHIKDSVMLQDTPSGDARTITFSLWGHPFMAINGGPYFTFNPSISFMVNFDPSRDANAEEMIHEVWGKLSEGGTVLMPFDKYPFSEKYGWIQDKYGVTWQLILTDPEGEVRPTIMPSLLFVNENYGKAEEAIHFYTSTFKNAELGNILHYPEGMEHDKAGAVMFSDFNLLGQWFVAMDSGLKHDYNFNEAISFMVYCDTQETIDYYWDKLSAVPEAEQCGWLKDKYGVSWQIVPEEQNEIMSSKSTNRSDRTGRIDEQQYTGTNRTHDASDIKNEKVGY